MSNELLAILIESYTRELRNALWYVKASNPELVEYGKNILGQDVEHVPCLIPIENVVDAMEDDVKKLLGGSKQGADK